MKMDRKPDLKFSIWRIAPMAAAIIAVTAASLEIFRNVLGRRIFDDGDQLDRSHF